MPLKPFDSWTHLHNITIKSGRVLRSHGFIHPSQESDKHPPKHWVFLGVDLQDIQSPFNFCFLERCQQFWRSEHILAEALGQGTLLFQDRVHCFFSESKRRRGRGGRRGRRGTKTGQLVKEFRLLRRKQFKSLHITGT